MSTHGGPKDIPLIDSVISNAVTPGSDVSTALSTKDREDISLLFLEVRVFPIAKQLFSSPHVSLAYSICSLQNGHLCTCAAPSLQSPIRW